MGRDFVLGGEEENGRDFGGEEWGDGGEKDKLGSEREREFGGGEGDDGRMDGRVGGRGGGVG